LGGARFDCQDIDTHDPSSTRPFAVDPLPADSADPALPVQGVGHRDVGLRDARTADHEHSQPGGRGPARQVRATPAASVQKPEFLKLKGRVVDVCGGAPCHAVP